ncbi:hypothetical protein L1987_55152 [Smallanthus sonchifolius]|uniref:Uncharacterized protein n=1 Tax=Smallanthus sonchifolius TaxID=185202 RepID=A0ACB9E918_9ASTR|nr:hypothetical protein L1987_55152 [Smallanthus sonchifolius]
MGVPDAVRVLFKVLGTTPASKKHTDSALARKGKNKAASSSTARAKNSRKQPETEQIPKPIRRKTEALCDQLEVWQEELDYENMAGSLSSPDNALQVEKAIRFPISDHWEFTNALRDWIDHSMRIQRVLDEDSQDTFKVHWFFSVIGLHDKENWKYTLTERKHILKDRKMRQVLFGVREDVTSLVEDIMEAEEEEGHTEENESESESETETKKATRRFKKSIQEHVGANRPTDYAGWDRPFQMLWDQNARNYEKLMIVIGMRMQEGDTMIGCMVEYLRKTLLQFLGSSYNHIRGTHSLL